MSLMGLFTGSRVAYLLNGLGGTTPLELGVMNNALLDVLKSEADIVPERVLVGNFMTALEMIGMYFIMGYLFDFYHYGCSVYIQ